MAEPQLLTRITLTNGLTLELWDHSRVLAGDRWLIRVEMRLPVELPDPLPGGFPEAEAAFVAAVGPTLVFSQFQERHFVAAQHRDAVLQELQNRLLELGHQYCAHPDFAARFVKRELAAFHERRRWDFS